jgi:anti-sigma factor RsiW
MTMECKEVQAVLIDYLDRAMDARSAAEVRVHLLGCEDCRKEVEEMRELMLAMADQEQRQPGPGLRENFQVMLQSELNMDTAGSLVRRAPGAASNAAGVRRGIGWMVAAACVLLAGGFWMGIMAGGKKGSDEAAQLGNMQKEIKDMKQSLLFSLIDDESASQRIKAVSYAEAIRNPEQKVIDVLVNALNHDKSVNVRLAALYSLGSWADNRIVRDSLVSSLPEQKEPLIQVLLINLLAAKKESRAIAPIKNILYDNNSLPVVKDAARKTLKTL